MPRKGAIIFRNIVGKLAVLRIECDGVAHNGLGLRVAREDLYHLATNVERAPSIVRKAIHSAHSMSGDKHVEYSPSISAIDLARRRHRRRVVFDGQRNDDHTIVLNTNFCERL